MNRMCSCVYYYFNFALIQICPVSSICLIKISKDINDGNSGFKVMWYYMEKERSERCMLFLKIVSLVKDRSMIYIA